MVSNWGRFCIFRVRYGTIEYWTIYKQCVQVRVAIEIDWEWRKRQKYLFAWKFWEKNMILIIAGWTRRVEIESQQRREFKNSIVGGLFPHSSLSDALEHTKVFCMAADLLNYS